MSIITPTSWNVAQPPPLPMRRFTVEEYHRLIQAGVFAEDERFELLEGWLIAKMTRNPPHDVAIGLLADALRASLRAGWSVRVQSAVTLADGEPEPDLVVVRGAVRDYVDHHPGPAEVALVIEVAESSLSRDRDLKGRSYARAAISTYWIANLVAGHVEVYTDPTGPCASPLYRVRRDHGIGDPLSVVIEGQPVAQIDPRDVLP